jgi:hypothetical protein
VGDESVFVVDILFSSYYNICYEIQIRYILDDKFEGIKEGFVVLGVSDLFIDI